MDHRQSAKNQNRIAVHRLLKQILNSFLFCEFDELLKPRRKIRFHKNDEFFRSMIHNSKEQREYDIKDYLRKFSSFRFCMSQIDNENFHVIMKFKQEPYAFPEHNYHRGLKIFSNLPLHLKFWSSTERYPVKFW